MLGLGWTEMLLVAVVALIVVGPKDLPVMLRQLGRTIGTVRRMGNDFRREFDKMTALDEIKDIRQSLTEPLRNAQNEIQREFNRSTSSGVEPTGALTADESGESVVEAIKTQAGMTDEAHQASQASMDEAMKRSLTPVTDETPDVPLELTGKSSPAKSKPASRSRARAKTAKAPEKGTAASKAATTSKSSAKSKPAAKAEAAPKPKTAKPDAKPSAKPKAAAASKSTASKSTASRSAAKPKAPAGSRAPAAAAKSETTGSAKPAKAPAKPRAARKPAAPKAETTQAAAKPAKPARRRAATKTQGKAGEA